MYGYEDNCQQGDSIKIPSTAVVPIYLLDKVEPVVVNIILGEGCHWFWSLPQSQVAIVRLTDDQIVQLLWWGVMVLDLVKNEPQGVGWFDSRYSISRHCPKYAVFCRCQGRLVLIFFEIIFINLFVHLN